MRDHDDGHAGIFLDFAKKHENRFAGGAVKIAGGFIGEENFGTIDQRAGDGGALLLAAGKLAGAMTAALVEADAREGFADARGPVTAVDFGEAERELDVFLERHAREEIERLEDHAYRLAAVAREFERGHFGEILAMSDDRAGSGAIESGNEIQKRGFSGAGAAEEGEEFARFDREGVVVHRADGGVAERVVAGDVVEADGRFVVGHRDWFGPTEYYARELS